MHVSLLKQLNDLKELVARQIPNTVDLLNSMSFVDEARRLELYPPFFFMGVKVSHLEADSKKLHVRLPLRWTSRNHHGTMFGGFIAALADPLPALLCARHFPGTDVWTKKCSVQFLRPGRSDLEVRVTVTDAQIAEIAAELKLSNASAPRFTYYFYDDRDRKVARISNTVAIKMRADGSAGALGKTNTPPQSPPVL